MSPAGPGESAEVGHCCCPNLFSPQACPLKASSWDGHAQRNSHRVRRPGAQLGPPPTGAGASVLLTRGSLQDGCRHSGSVPTPRKPVHACSATPPPLGAGQKLVIDRHTFGSPLPCFYPSASPVGQSPALTSCCAIWFPREAARPDTLNDHPFITSSIATPAKPCRALWAPRRQLKSPCSAVGWREQSRFTGPCLGAIQARSTQSTNGSRSEYIKL